MKTPIIITHRNCFDGLGAAYAAKVLLQGKCEIIFDSYDFDADMETKPNNQKIFLDHSNIDITGRDIYIFDLSYSERILNKLKEKARTLFLLDHHATAKQKLGHLSYCHFDLTKSGCVLAWEWLSQRMHNEILPLPEILLYVQDRDLWHHRLPQTESILEYMVQEISITTNPPHVQLSIFEDLANGWDADFYARQGSLALTFKRGLVKRLMYNRFNLTFIMDNSETLKYITLPACFCPWELRSEVGHNLAKLPDNPHQVGIAITGVDKKGQLVFSARGLTDTTLAAELAVLYGGGGHNTAASGRFAPHQLGELIQRALLNE